MSGMDNEALRQGEYKQRDVYEVAKEKGLIVKLPSENELFIDIDTRLQEDQFFSMFNRLKEEYPNMSTSITPSQSGKPERKHIVVTLPFPVKELERVILQAILGSDPIREFLNLVRIWEEVEVVTCFFEKEVKL